MVSFEPQGISTIQPDREVVLPVVDDLRHEYRTRYQSILGQRGLLIDKIDQTTIPHVDETSKKFKAMFDSLKSSTNIDRQAIEYQSAGVYALYLGQIYALLEQTNIQDTSIVALKKDFESFENFARSHLLDLPPKNRALLRQMIGKYVLSLVYEPNSTGKQDFNRTPGY